MSIRGNLKNIMKSNLIEYVYYFTLVSFVITSILGGSLYLYFSSLLRNETIQSNNNILAQLKNAQEVILSEVDNSMSSIVLDSFVVNFEDYYRNKDIITVNQVQKKLESMAALDKSIESIYIYFVNSNYVLSSNSGYIKSQEFDDFPFISGLKDNNIANNEAYSRSIYSSRQGVNMPVITFVKPVPIVFYNMPNAYVVINIKTDYLQRAIDYINVRKGSSVVVINQQGDIVSQKEDIRQLNSENIHNYINLDDKSPIGYNIKSVDGSKMLISFINSDKYKLKFIYIIPMSTITSNIRFLGGITIIICSLMLAISIALSFVLSKRIYSPIQSILRLFSNGSETNMPSESDSATKATTIIAQGVNSLIDNNKILTDRNKDLEVIASDYKIYQKNKFLKGIVDGSRTIDETIADRLEYYDIYLYTEGYFATCTISMDNYSDFLSQYTEKQQNMLSIYITESITDIIFKNYKGFIVETKNNELVVLINLEESFEKDKAKSVVLNLSSQVHTVISESLKYTFTLGVSLLHKGVNNIPECYTESICAVNHRLLLGYNHVILYESIKGGIDNRRQYPFSIEKNILNGLKVGDRESVFNSLDEFVRYIYNSPSENLDFVRNYLLQLLSASAKCLYEIDKNMYIASLSEKDIYSELLKRETLQNMASYIKQLYDGVLKYLEDTRSMKNTELVNSVVSYIKDNLQTDLSIDRLAEQFYISSSYLRKIFKDECGETIKEFIDAARMKKAKVLLESSDLKIGDIAVQIGYASVQTFTRAFKMKTGKSPGEYRTDYLSRGKE